MANETPTPSEVTLINTRPILQDIVEALEDTPIDLDLLAQHFPSNSPPGLLENLSNLTGFLSELWLKTSLSQIMQDFNLGDQVDLDPFPQFRQTTGFIIEKDSIGAIRVYQKGIINPAPPYTEYDQIIVIDTPGQETLLVLFEIKLDRRKVRGNTKSPGGRARSHIMSPEFINFKFAPLQEYFPQISGFAYLLVIPADQHNPVPESNQANFINRGGILVRFPAAHEDFRLKVCQFSVNFAPRP